MQHLTIWLAFCLLLTIWSCKTDRSSVDLPSPEDIEITWHVLDDAVDDEGKRTAVFTIRNLGDLPFPKDTWALYYSQFPNEIHQSAEMQSIFQIDHLNGDLHRITPGDSFPILTPGQAIELSYQSLYRLVKRTHGPHGLYFVFSNAAEGDQIISVEEFSILPFPQDITFQSQDQARKIHVDAKELFEQNSQIRELPLEDLPPIIPKPIFMERRKGFFSLTSKVNLQYESGLGAVAELLSDELNSILLPSRSDSDPSDHSATIQLKIEEIRVEGISDEAYHLSIDPRRIEIIGSDVAGVYYGIQSLKALWPPDIYVAPIEELKLAAYQIKDAPRFSYRGLHVDIARNFHDEESLKKIISVMSFHKLNKLHLHITDDEGWRLEIPDLPELTDIGARRGHGFIEGFMLPPAYGSGGIDSAGAGTGYLARSEFIDLLEYAVRHQVDIIPEINGPGHARAAIVAMANRYQRLSETGNVEEAAKYLLHDPKDRSNYTSAQGYDDNVMCVCQESTFGFLAKVIAELVAMYEEAQAPLSIIHIGGDEVPTGAWQGSPKCQQLIAEVPALKGPEDLMAYFVSKYQQIAEGHDLRIGGWEEIVLEIDQKGGHAPNLDLLSKRPIPYVWNSVVGSGNEDLIYRLANLGFEVVMCNASNLYLDMAYNRDPSEPGLYWAGYVDTKNVFELTPYNLFQTVFSDEEGNPLNGMAIAEKANLLQDEARSNLLGIQGTLWTEVIASQAVLEYQLLPKMLGLAERAWAQAPDWLQSNDPSMIKLILEREWNQFANQIGKIALPKLDYMAGGYHYRIPPPGAAMEGGLLKANVAFPGLEIRYTIDGSDPNPQSKLYTQPTEIPLDAEVRLRTFSKNNRASRITQIITH